MQTSIKRWLAEGRALVAHKDYTLALIPLKQVVRQASVGPEASEAWRIQCQALVALGHLEQALDAANHAVQSQSDSLEALDQRFQVYGLLKRPTEAIGELERMVHLEPQRAGLWEQLGSAHLDLGDYSAALRALDQALVIHPHLPRALHGRAIALDGLGQHKESLAAYQRARQEISREDPISIWVLTNSALALQSAHRLAEALALAEEACRLSGTPQEQARAHAVAGNILMSLRRYSDALERYEQAYAITPQNPKGWQGKGAALLALNQPEAALVALDEGVRLDPADAELQRARQKALAQTLLVRTPRLAVEAPEFTQIDDPTVWTEQMQRYMQLRRLPEVEAAANQVLRLDPANVDAYIYKGNAQLAMKQFRAGLATLKRGVLLSWHGLRASDIPSSK